MLFEPPVAAAIRKFTWNLQQQTELWASCEFWRISVPYELILAHFPDALVSRGQIFKCFFIFSFLASCQRLNPECLSGLWF